MDRRPLRIAHVNDVAAVGSTLARAMTELGEDARLIEPVRVGTRIPYPWRVATLPLRAAGIVGAGLAIRTGGYDVAHVHYARLGMIGPLGGRPFALHVHGTDLRGVRPGSLWARETAPFLRRAGLVYYATPDLAEWVRPFRNDAILLPNPIENERFSPLAAADPARRTRRDLLVGVRLSAIKGLPVIVDVLRLVAARRPDTTITIVEQGEGLVDAVAAAGPSARTVPRTSRTELPALLRAHRLALGQFIVGELGGYELECLSAGVPVVMRLSGSDRADGPPVVNAADAREAAERIVALLDDEAALDAIAERGPTWVAANHAARTVARRVLDDYRRAGLVRG